MKNHRFLMPLLVVLVTACGTPITPDNPDNPANKISIEGLTLDNFPFMDCSTSTSPLRNMIMFTLLDIPFQWGLDIVSGSQYNIYWSLPKGMKQGSPEHIALADKLNMELLKSNGSHDAYVNLIDGETSVIIDSRDISRNELKYSEEKNVKIETKPIALDAMAFIVHPSNIVNSLTIEQIQKIYTGEITNWKEVGGEDLEIHPYMRDADSGSQEKMETLIMKGLKMLDWPEMYLTSMISPFVSVEMDPKGIAYSPYYFCSRMVDDLRDVKVIGINGVYPEKESILAGNAGKTTGAYPFSSHIYAAIRADEPATSFAHQIYDLLLNDTKAKNIIDESGYIAIR